MAGLKKFSFFLILFALNAHASGPALEKFLARREALRPHTRFEEHLPAVRFQPGPSLKGVVIIVHGITDTPLGLKPLADRFFDEGWDVILPLLRGHGTEPRDLLGVTFENWVEDAVQALEVAAERQAGSGLRHVVLLGASIGALVSSHAYLEHPAMVDRLALFVPAYQPRDYGLGPLLPLACLPGTRNQIFKKDISKMTQFEKDHYYQEFPLSAVCELFKGANEIRKNAGWKKFAAPTFYLMSELDDVIENSAVMKAYDETPGKGVSSTLFKFEKSSGVHHGEVGWQVATDAMWGALEASVR